jgi:hypothetical protein
MVCWQVGTGQEYTLPLETFELSFAVRRLITLDIAGYIPGGVLGVAEPKVTTSISSSSSDSTSALARA